MTGFDIAVAASIVYLADKAMSVAEIIGNDSTKAVMIHRDRIMKKNGFD